MGSTNDVKARASQYRHEGYRGKILHAPTANMRKAEDKLLQGKKKPIHNQQRLSNNAEKRGSVYVIKGRKNSKK